MYPITPQRLSYYPAISKGRQVCMHFNHISLSKLNMQSVALARLKLVAPIVWTAEVPVARSTS